MSLDLLKALNGTNDGGFAKFIKRHKSAPAICWYPSAGADFRDLLYLSLPYAAYHLPTMPDPVFPDLYLHTDYYPWRTPDFLDRRMLHLDHRTSICVDTVEELPRLDLPLDPSLVDFSEAGPATGRVMFLTLDVYSDALQACFKAHLLYAFVENTAFCAKVLLRHKAILSHLIHVRYGSSFGGSRAAGGWLRGVLPLLSCQMFISDGRHDDWRAGDSAAVGLFPELADKSDADELRPIRSLPAASWSNYGDVTWLHRVNVSVRK